MNNKLILFMLFLLVIPVAFATTTVTRSLSGSGTTVTVTYTSTSGFTDVFDTIQTGLTLTNGGDLIKMNGNQLHIFFSGSSSSAIFSASAGTYTFGPGTFTDIDSATGSVTGTSSVTVGGGCTDTCTSKGYTCGTWTICGTSQSCGSCSGGQTCNSGTCTGGGNTVVTRSLSGSGTTVTVTYTSTSGFTDVFDTIQSGLTLTNGGDLIKMNGNQLHIFFSGSSSSAIFSAASSGTYTFGPGTFTDINSATGSVTGTSSVTVGNGNCIDSTWTTVAGASDVCTGSYVQERSNCGRIRSTSTPGTKVCTQSSGSSGSGMWIWLGAGLVALIVLFKASSNN